METPITEHSDSDSGESWTMLDNDTGRNADSPLFGTQKLHKSVIDNTCDKDEDTDGISIISDSEPESPFHIESSSVILESSPVKQAIEEDIPVYTSQDIDVETNVTCAENDKEPLVEDDESGENLKHKIYVHRRNNRLSTVLNIIMLVSVMTAAGVAIGHMWGVKHDCPSHTTPSFNKILSDLYKLQAENANYRNKLRELSLIIEDNLHYECERESEVSLNKQQISKCRQQKITNMQKYLKSSQEEGKRYKRSINSNTQRHDETKLKKSNQNQLPLQNISKIKPGEIEQIDKMSIPEIVVTHESLEPDKYDGGALPLMKENKDNIWRDTKISYTDSLKSHNININIKDQNVYQNNGKTVKQYKKVKVTEDETIEPSSSEEEYVKEHHTAPKQKKLKQKLQRRQKPFKNSKRRNKHENWDIKEGILKYYHDMSKPENVDDLVGDKKNRAYTEDNKSQTRESNEGKLHHYDDYFKQEGTDKKYSKPSNWYDNRVKLRKEARKRQQLELLNVSTASSGDWYFKRMLKREECRDKANSTCKGNNKKKEF